MIDSFKPSNSEFKDLERAKDKQHCGTFCSVWAAGSKKGCEPFPTGQNEETQGTKQNNNNFKYCAKVCESTECKTLPTSASLQQGALVAKQQLQEGALKINKWCETFLDDLTGPTSRADRNLRNTFVDALDLETNEKLKRLVDACFPSQTPIFGFWLSLITIKGKTEGDKSARKDTPGCLADAGPAIAESIHAYVMEHAPEADMQTVDEYKDKKASNFFIAARMLKNKLDEEMKKEDPLNRGIVVKKLNIEGKGGESLAAEDAFSRFVTGTGKDDGNLNTTEQLAHGLVVLGQSWKGIDVEGDKFQYQCGPVMGGGDLEKLIRNRHQSSRSRLQPKDICSIKGKDKDALDKLNSNTLLKECAAKLPRTWTTPMAVAWIECQDLDEDQTRWMSQATFGRQKEPTKDQNRQNPIELLDDFGLQGNIDGKILVGNFGDLPKRYNHPAGVSPSSCYPFGNPEIGQMCARTGLLTENHIFLATNGILRMTGPEFEEMYKTFKLNKADDDGLKGEQYMGSNPYGYAGPMPHNGLGLYAAIKLNMQVELLEVDIDQAARANFLEEIEGLFGKEEDKHLGKPFVDHIVDIVRKSRAEAHSMYTKLEACLKKLEVIQRNKGSWTINKGKALMFGAKRVTEGLITGILWNAKHGWSHRDVHTSNTLVNTNSDGEVVGK